LTEFIVYIDRANLFDNLIVQKRILLLTGDYFNLFDLSSALFCHSPHARGKSTGGICNMTQAQRI